MKRILCILALILVSVVAFSACGCAEHIDRNGDGRCDRCVARMPEDTAAATTAPVTTAAPLTFLPDEQIATALAEGLASAYPGARLDIGLTAATAPYYSFPGEEEYVRLNEDGTVEIIGIRAGTAILTLKGPEGREVYEGFYSVGTQSVSIAVRRALAAEGLIASASADAPASAIARLEAFSLADYPVTDAARLAVIGRMTSLRALTLSGCTLGDLSYLEGLTSLSQLDISYSGGLALDDGGLAIIKRLRALPALASLSVEGSFSTLNRQIFDSLITMVANGELTLTVAPDMTLSADTVEGFSQTVFFSLEEYRVHLERNGGALTPAAGCSHALLVFPAADGGRDAPIVANAIDRLFLYGVAGVNYITPVTSDGDLEVTLYSYALRAPRENFCAGIAVSGALTLRAAGGASTVSGAGWDSPEATYLWAGGGIKAASLDLYTAHSGTLTVVGGRGSIGRAGVTDTYSPDSPLTTKNGGMGEGGGTGIFVTGAVTIHSADMTVYGGRGGRGGDGAKGSSENIFGGGYDGGNGGNGGIGGNALVCGSLVYGEELSEDEKDAFPWDNLIPGDGGAGGAPGGGFLAGKTGAVGTVGNSGERITYR